ncbi:MAG: glycoside hydrolase family 18 protein [Clostridium sp.]|nr:glycoside hydrolase family 18 protein [Clostridium sp.]
MKKTLFAALCAAAVAAGSLLLGSCNSKNSTAADDQQADSTRSRIVVAYVTAGSDVMPDPTAMTHINYAFGHVNETFNGINVDNPDRLHKISALKEQNPDLKVILSVGGWGSGRFSEMAADSANRAAFAADCERVIKEFNLDGVDIDWEYPTSSSAGISSSPEDTDNYTLLMRDIRAAIGDDKSLTLATPGSAEYYDFPAILPYVDFINIMSYDIGSVPYHQSPLYPSEHSKLSADEALKAHLAAGIPKDKLTLGLPFYGRGFKEYPDYMDYKDLEVRPGCKIVWDEKAQVPYIENADGELVLGYNDPRSIEIKCQYILDQDILGAMYWEYTCDNEQGELRTIVADYMMGDKGEK